MNTDSGSLTHKTDDEGDSTQKRSVVGIQTPEGTESPFRTDQDIALLFLSEPFQETVYVKKIGTTSYITLDDDRPSNKIIAFISSKMVSTIPSKFQLTSRYITGALVKWLRLRLSNERADVRGPP